MYAEGEHNISMTSESHRPSICGTQIPNLYNRNNIHTAIGHSHTSMPYNIILYTRRIIRP